MTSKQDSSGHIAQFPESLIKRFWNEWFTAYIGREVLTVNGERINRVFLKHPKDFQHYVKECWQNHVPCYMSVQPFLGRGQVGCIEKLFFDFDCSSDIEKARMEALRLAKTLQDFYDAVPLIVFSGHKGYHIYVWLRQSIISANNSDLKRLYETLQKTLLRGLNLKTLDWQIIGDVKRLARVPYTKHEKTGNLCVPVTSNGKPVIVTSLEGYRNHGLPNSFVKFCIRRIHQERSFKKLRIFKLKSIERIRPCILEALRKPLEGGNGHLMRLAIACEFLSRGYNIDDIVQLFATQLDFNEEKTRYFVEHAKRSNYKPFKCKTIRKLGFCLKQDHKAHAYEK